MKVTNDMIDKQLSFMGKVMGTMLKSADEKKFRKIQKMTHKLLSGSNVKGLLCSEIWIPRAKDGSKMRVRIYKPLISKDNVPGVLWLHGGGYAFGLPEMNGGLYQNLIKASECVIVAPDYRLAVHAPYPAALEDCYETLLWMKDHANELGIRMNQLMVGGESAGGGLTAALSLYARDKGDVKIAFQMPLYPMIDDRMITESAVENNAPVWNSNLNREAWKLYLGDLFKKNVPAYAAPSRASDYSNLPPTATFVGDLEPFRDETIKYVEDLKKAGVPVNFEIYKGCYHAFDRMQPKAEVSKKATQFLMNAFKYAVEHYFAEQI